MQHKPADHQKLEKYWLKIPNELRIMIYDRTLHAFMEDELHRKPEIISTDLCGSPAIDCGHCCQLFNAKHSYAILVNDIGVFNKHSSKNLKQLLDMLLYLAGDDIQTLLNPLQSFQETIGSLSKANQPVDLMHACATARRNGARHIAREGNTPGTGNECQGHVEEDTRLTDEPLSLRH